jgi:hypothetical protein
MFSCAARSRRLMRNPLGGAIAKVVWLKADSVYHSCWSARGAVGPLCQRVPKPVVQGARCAAESRGPLCRAPVSCSRAPCGGEPQAAPVMPNESRAGTSSRQGPLCRSSPVRQAAPVKGCTSQSKHPPNPRLQPTPLCGDRDRAFFGSGKRLDRVPALDGGAAEAQSVGWLAIVTRTKQYTDRGKDEYHECLRETHAYGCDH